MSKTAFVLMPFSEEYQDIYELGIKEAAKEFNVTAKRLDDQIFDSDMLQEIYRQIDKSDFIIADMTGRNPNVFYEVGYADAKKKMIILLTQNSNDIPFDLSHRPHVIYEGSITKLKNELKTRIEWIIKEIDKRINSPVSISLKVDKSDLEKSESTDTASLNYNLEISNLTDSKITGLEIIYLHTGPGWTFFKDKVELKKSKSDIPPFTERHLLKSDISIIPHNDQISIEFAGKKIVYAEWRKNSERKDKYNLQGKMCLIVHGQTFTQNAELYIETEVKYFSWDDDDIPF